MPQPSVSVLVVDDESPLRKALRGSLSASGFIVEEARSGEEAVNAVQQASFDVVLLDMNMPGMGGLEACKRIRDLRPNAGIVMVTVRDAEDDKVSALESGADDYVTKPFQLRELIARLRAVLRRTQLGGAKENEEVVRVGDLVVNLKRRSLMRSGKSVRLSPKEFDLLALMMQNKDLPLTHVKMLRTIWGPEYGGELEYLRTYIRMLRKKIEDNPDKPVYIVTEPWVGYRFCDPQDSEAAAVPEP
jgi:two-component system KDP operon response regulator KdpE